MALSLVQFYIQLLTSLRPGDVWIRQCRIIAGSGNHYFDVMISALASQITGVSIVCSTVCFRHMSKKISKLRVTCLCEGNSPVTSEFPAQMVSNAENVSIRWRHHGFVVFRYQVITWNNTDMLAIASLGTKRNENCINVQKFSFIKMHLKVSSSKWRPFCTGPNVLNECGFIVI